LQRPGFSADYRDQRYERMDLAYKPSDWTPTAAAEALIRNNSPLLGYIAGKPAAFTSKDHLFRAGETVEKQLVVINESRQTVGCRCTWSFELPNVMTGTQHVEVPTGEQSRVPLKFELPRSTPPGEYAVTAKFEFTTGDVQEDVFTIHVLPSLTAAKVVSRIAVFDPRGETRGLLDAQRIRYQAVTANNDLSGFDVLVVGKQALTVDGAAPDIARVRDGLRVLLFEQSSDVLEQRFGFRVAEYGLRSVFARVPDHPLLAGYRNRSCAIGAALRRWCRRRSLTRCVPGMDRR